MGQIPDHAPAFVSVVNEFPEDLHQAMGRFIGDHPQWDQYRLMQAALAGFLFQQGCQERAVVRHYLDGLFRRDPQPSTIPPLSSSGPQSGQPHGGQPYGGQPQRGEPQRGEPQRSQRQLGLHRQGW